MTIDVNADTISVNTFGESGLGIVSTKVDGSALTFNVTEYDGQQQFLMVDVHNELPV
jgi:hypothetical protein